MKPENQTSIFRNAWRESSQKLLLWWCGNKKNQLQDSSIEGWEINQIRTD